MSVVLCKDGDKESGVHILDVLTGQSSNQEAEYVCLVEKGVPTPLGIFLGLLQECEQLERNNLTIIIVELITEWK